MKTRSRILATLLFAVMVLSLSFFAVSCKSKDTGTSESESTSVAETSETRTATYYCDVEGFENEIVLHENSYILSIAGEYKAGSFTLKSGEMKLSVDGAEVAASISGDELAITYGGKSYVFLEKIGRTVTYAGADAASETVVNGKTATRPEDPASTATERFIGWYTSEDYTETYNFANPVRENVTVYARFVTVQPGQEEFTATLYNGSEKVASVQTTGGKLYNLPVYGEKDGKAFDGWYVSDFNSADKPTSVYADQTLTQNVNLYATWKEGISGVNVSADKITWDAIGSGAQSFTVTVTNPAGSNTSQNVTTNEAKYDFAKADAGEYTITVANRNGEETATVYYNNKALDRVSLFNVLQPSGMLTYNPVAGAEKYIVTVNCGNDAHNHANYDNGTSTYFDISNCDMQEGGIKVTVTAMANGMVSSVSETYCYDRTLEAVQGVSVNGEGEVVWFRTNDAFSYVVTVNGEEVEVGDATSYSLRYYGAGSYVIGVYPVAKGYNSPAATEINYTKTQIAAPDGVTVTGGTITWNAVEGATGYTLKFNNNVVTVTEPTYTMTEDQLQNASTIEISVSAKGTSDAANSYYSDVCTVGRLTLGDVTYENGTVYWNPVYVAAGYRVQLNEEEPETYEAGVTSAPVVFTQAGANTVSVAYVYADGTVGAVKNVVVNTYAVVYNVEGGNHIDTAYIAVGDKIPAPEAVSIGYDFGGWYDVPSGGVNNGKKFTESTLTRNAAVQLYAYFTPKSYTVTLDTANGGTVEDSVVKVVFRQDYVLPAAVSDNEQKVFAGWYSEPNGAGIQYAGNDGVGITAWSVVGDVTVYAYWVDIFSFELNAMDEYLVSSGLGIGYVTSATVPATYDGKKVATINILTNATGLLSIRIPDTVSIVTGTEQGVSTSSFQSCTSLQSIEVYSTGEPTPKYVTEDGAMYVVSYGDDDTVAYKTLFIVPLGKKGELRIADDTDEIGSYAMYKSKIEKVVIPAKISVIRENAMASCTYLTEVEFLAEDEGAAVEPLVLEAGVFKTTTALTRLVLPSRLMESVYEETGTDGSVTKTLHFDPTILDSCTSLESLEMVGSVKGYYSVIDGLLCNADGTEVIYCPRGRTEPVTFAGSISVIQEEAFYKCTKIEKVVVSAGIEMIGKKAFASCSKLIDLTFLGVESDNPLTICETAFLSCTVLESVVLPENLVRLEKNAFGSTSKLLTVTILSSGAGTGSVEFSEAAFGSVTTTASSIPTYYVKNLTIGAKVPVLNIPSIFGNKITHLEVDPSNENYSAKDSVLYDKSETQIIFYPLSKAGAFTIPSTVTTIPSGVFRDNKGLTSIEIPASVTSIGDFAFYGCSAMTSVVFAAGDAPLTLGGSVFRSCTSLTKFTLPARLASTGTHILASCSKLEKVTVEEGAKSIGNYAFYSCSKLKEIYLPSTLETLGECDEDGNIVSMNVFESSNYIEKIVVAEGSERFASQDGILYLVKDGVISDLIVCPAMNGGVEGVITIPATVTKVWDKAFYYNKAVAKIVFEESEDEERELTLGTWLFYQTTNLVEVVLPHGVTNLSREMFYHSGVQKVNVPNTVTMIEANAFDYAKTLKTIVFEEGGTEPLVIADATTTTGSLSAIYAPFYGCVSLTEIALPERTSYIGAYGLTTGNSTTTNVSQIKSIRIPSTVTGLGAYVLQYAANLTEVIFAEGSQLTEIPGYAFYYCTSLRTISLPESVTSIGLYAFSHSALQAISLAEGMTEIGYNAFSYTALTEITIPSTVTRLGGKTTLTGSTIGGYTFAYCYDLASVTFAEGSQLSSIESYAFYHCEALTALEIPDGVTSFGSYVFGYCGITSLTMPAALTSIGASAFAYSSVQSVVIPASVTSIGASAFAYCRSLASVTFEEGCTVSSIGNYAFRDTALESFAFPETSASKLTLGTALFQNAQKLVTVHLSSDVTSVDNVFSGCSAIEEITVAEENLNFCVEEGANILYNKDKTAIRYIFGENSGVVVIPEGTVEISARAFMGQAGMTKVYIPASIRSIGTNAFQSCWGLEEVVFVDGCPSLTTLNDYTFADCFSLKTITLPTYLASIGKNVFQNCSALTTVIFGDSVKKLDNYAFDGTASLTDIDLPSSLTTLGTYVFRNSGITSVEIPASIKSIGTYAFSDSSLKRITFANDGTSLTSFGTYAFKGSNLESIVIPKNVTTLGTNLFQNCENLREVTFAGTKIKTIPNYAFDGCTSLTSIEIPSGVTAVNGYAFHNCTSLNNVVLPDSLTLIGTAVSATTATSSALYTGYVFQNCTSLTEIDLPDSVEFIATRSFENTGLVSVKLPSSLKYLYQRPVLPSKGYSSWRTVSDTSTVATYFAAQFASCQNLTEVILPAGLEALGPGVFQDCPNLTRIVYDGYTGSGNALPASLAEITGCAFKGVPITNLTVEGLTKAYNYAFSSADQLKSITFANDCKITEIPGYCFRYDEMLETVVLPDNITIIGTYAFSDCTALGFLTLPAKVTETGNYAFAYSGLKAIDVSNVTTMGTYTFGYCEGLESVVLNENLTKIANGTFFDCYALANLVIPKDVTVFESNAFVGTAMKVMTIPVNVASIANNVFSGMDSLEKFVIEDGNPNYYVEEDCLYTAEGKLLNIPAGKVFENGTFVVPEGKTIDTYVFNGCDSIKVLDLSLTEITALENYTFTHFLSAEEIILPETLETIGTYAFRRCDSLTKIVIPESVTSIGNYAFQYTKSLETYTVPYREDLTVGTGVFQYSGLKSVTIEEGYTQIPANTFQYCASLTEVNLPESLEWIGSYVFSGCTALETINIPANVVNLCAITTSTVSSTSTGYVFDGCTSLRSVNFLGNKVEHIGTYTFRGTTALESISLPASLQTLGNYAFTASGLKSMVVDGSYLGTYTFKDSEALESIEFTENVTTIPSYTFQNCSALKSVTIPASVTNVATYAFSGSAVEKVVVLSKEITFANYVFKGCESLVSVDFPADMTSLTLGSYMFESCTSLKTIRLPEALTAIPTYIFQYSGLTAIEIPGSVETIGTYAFRDCTSLVSVNLGNVETISANAFIGCTSIRSIVIPRSVSSVLGSAFSGWTSAQTINIVGRPYDVAQLWNNAWATGCQAKVVWNYTAE